MTHYIVKLLLTDWPKRSLSARKELSVVAETVDRALEFAVIQARNEWPGCKPKAYDAIVDRSVRAEGDTPVPYVPLKRGPGRPRNVA